MVVEQTGAPVPTLRFPRGEHFAFYYEDTHLLYLSFARDQRRFLFLIADSEDDALALDFPGDLYEEQVRDAVDRIFFVDLQQEGRETVSLVLGAFFPVNGRNFGAYYERGSDERSLYFLEVIGAGDEASLEAVEEGDDHQRVAAAFTRKYEGILQVH
ncbi:MAG: hypothetical protein OWU32_09925 [Firmicutes bacterium]|nr:hypothetical protein [Bacillota bacterium]